MSLMNTTVLTRHNEKLRIPNHLLFHEHITNLSEGSVSTFEIPVVFALDGPLKCSQEKIHTFINNVKKFAKEDNKQDWIDVIVFCDEVSFSTNQMKYTFWCTHRAAFDEVSAISVTSIKFTSFELSLLICRSFDATTVTQECWKKCGGCKLNWTFTFRKHLNCFESRANSEIYDWFSLLKSYGYDLH